MRLTPEQNQMVEENLNLALYALKYYKNKFGWLEPEEILSACYLGLIKAVRGFKPEKEVRFGTYAMRVIYSTIIKELTPSKQVIETSSLEEIALDIDGEGSNWESCFGTDSPEDELVSKLTAEQIILKINRENPGKGKAKTRAVVNLLYFYPYLTQQEVAEILGCSQKNVSLILKNIRKKHRQELVI